MVFCTESVGSSCMPNSTRRFDSSIVMWNVVSAKLARLSQKVWTTGQFQNRLGMDSTSCWQPNEQVSLTRGTKWLTILLVLRLPLLSWGLVQQWKVVCHSIKGRVLFPLTHCICSFYSNHEVKQHIVTAHENQRPHVCTQCGKSFPLRKQLKKHETVHDRSTIYTCALCNKKFYYKESHRNHVKKDHPTRNPNDIIIISDNCNMEEEKTPFKEGTRARLK